MKNDKMIARLIGRRNGLLVPTNPDVQKLATRLHWTPERAIIRIQRALPAVMEQEIYLALASDFGILPESMATLLRFYLGEQELRIEDLKPVSAGPNLARSKFANFAEFLRECLNLLKIVTREFTSFTINIEYAAQIVTHYGVNQPEMLIEMVDNNLEELCEALGIGNKKPYPERMRNCIWIMVTKIIPQNKANGIPDLLDITDFLAVPRSRRDEFRRLISEELPDEMSDHGNALWRRLRKEGII